MPETNYNLLRFQSDNIPKFDGNPKLLQRYLNSCENLIKAFQDIANPNAQINICLTDTVLGKLTGRAADLIVSRSELKTWTDIKNTLINCFADQRSIDCLIQDLINLKPFKNESPINFGMRIQDSRSLLFSKLNATNELATEKLMKIRHYEEFALKTFINGLPYNLQLIVRLKNPDCLEKAMSFVREEENFLYFKNHSYNNTHTQQSLRHPTPQTKPQHNFKSNIPIFKPNYQPMYSQFNNNNHQNYSNYGIRDRLPDTRTFMPRQNQFNNQPSTSNQFQRNLPNNNQQFGRPNFGQRPNSNTFRQNKPSSSNSRLNRVEPMDTSSGNTVLHQNIITRSDIEQSNTQNNTQNTNNDFENTNNDFEYNNTNECSYNYPNMTNFNDQFYDEQYNQYDLENFNQEEVLESPEDQNFQMISTTQPSI